MLSTEDICNLAEDKRFIRNKYTYANLFLSGRAISESCSSISLSFSKSNTNMSIGVKIIKVLFSVLKVFFISHEIGKFKNAVIIDALDKYPDNEINIRTLIASDYIWLEEDLKKIKMVSEIVLQYLGKPKNKLLIIQHYKDDSVSNKDKEKQYQQFVEYVYGEFKKEIIYLISQNLFDECPRDIKTEIYEENLKNIISKSKYGNLTKGE